MTLRNKTHEHCLLPATQAETPYLYIARSKATLSVVPFLTGRHKADLTLRTSQLQERAVEGLVTECEAQSKVCGGTDAPK